MLAGRKQRLQTFARRRRQMDVHERIQENEMMSILEQEMPRFIKMTKPVFLLRPEMERQLHHFLQTQNRQHGYSMSFFSKNTRDQAHFYKKELSVFIKYLQNKDFQLKGNEALFAQVLLNHLAIINFQQKQKRYGTLAWQTDRLIDVFDRYLALVNEKDYYQIDHLEFLRQNLISKRLVPVTMSQNRLKRQLRQHEKTNDVHRLNKMAKRLQETQ
ncbi:hypothetical protein [Natribacillus halophilus]|uniref:Uncharacterized protein n=1 Tax=Natribacillus halophilus TaxID=549003 RepID=A0A1G8J880_9BACI|nr:hypothetical protein [Natribacillus halophilus]SDI27187.1 hypothetical protein SAMN04488123_10174 [Natribacillus halophilus]